MIDGVRRKNEKSQNVSPSIHHKDLENIAANYRTRGVIIRPAQNDRRHKFSRVTRSSAGQIMMMVFIFLGFFADGHCMGNVKSHENEITHANHQKHIISDIFFAKNNIIPTKISNQKYHKIDGSFVPKNRAERNIIISKNDGTDNKVTRTVEYSLYEELKTPVKLGNLKKDAKLEFSNEKNVSAILKFHFRIPKSLKKSNDIGLFRLDESTSDLFVIKRLDRDALCQESFSKNTLTKAITISSTSSSSVCIISFDIIVKPTSHFRIIKVTIKLMDLNDNSPKFEKTSTKIFISESSPVGSLFPLPSAEDEDAGLNSVQEYSLISDSSNFELQVTHQADGSTDVRLKLTSALDREIKDFYKATLVAIDGGRPPKSASIDLEISVLDANDHPPKFNKQFYHVTVPENASSSTPLINVVATDEDLGLNGKVFYSLSPVTLNTYGSVFGVNSLSGLVYLKQKLDYEKIKRYKLMIVAANEDAFETALSSTAILEVIVDDVNDNAPEISVNNLTPSEEAEVLENAEKGMFVAHVVVNDADSLAGGEVTCSLINQSNFNLVKLFNNEYKITTKKVFDREKQHLYEISIKCSDNGNPPLESVERLNVSIVNQNEYPPYFQKPVYHATVSETAVTGFQVIKMKAFDEDLNQGSFMKYNLKLLTNDGKESNDKESERNFIIGSTDGVVKVNALLDYERQGKYAYKVSVTDDPSNPLNGTTILMIKIEDENDNKPVFDSANGYQFVVKENQKEGVVVGRVRALDADISEEYKKVVYATDKNNSIFRINETNGEIKVLRKLDREKKDEYKFLIKAGNVDRKGLFLDGLSSWAEVKVSVEDSNDNFPVFIFPNATHHRVHISERINIGDIIAHCRAVDADAGINGQLIYSIVKGNKQHAFKIDANNGIIKAGQKIHEIFKNSSNHHNSSAKHSSTFHLTIKASDCGFKSLSSKADLYIHLTPSSPNVSAMKSRSWRDFWGLFEYVPFFLMTLAGIVGCVLVLGCLFCAMYFFCKISKKRKVPRVFRENKMYLVENFKNSSENFEGMSRVDDKFNSIKSLNAWSAKKMSSSKSGLVNDKNKKSTEARRSMPNLGRTNFSKSYEAAFCNCHLSSLKAVNRTSTLVTTVSNTLPPQVSCKDGPQQIDSMQRQGDDLPPSSQARDQIFLLEHRHNTTHYRNKTSPLRNTLPHLPSNTPHTSNSRLPSKLSNNIFRHPSASYLLGKKGFRCESSGCESDSTCSCSDSGRGLSEDERVRHRRVLRQKSAFKSVWGSMPPQNRIKEIHFDNSVLSKEKQLPPPAQRKNPSQKPLQVSFRLSLAKALTDQSPKKLPNYQPPTQTSSNYQVHPENKDLKTHPTPPNNMKTPQIKLEIKQFNQQFSQTPQVETNKIASLTLPGSSSQYRPCNSIQKALPKPQQHNLTAFVSPPQNQLLNFSTPPSTIPINEKPWKKIIANATSEV